MTTFPPGTGALGAFDSGRIYLARGQGLAGDFASRQMPENTKNAEKAASTACSAPARTPEAEIGADTGVVNVRRVIGAMREWRQRPSEAGRAGLVRSGHLEVGTADHTSSNCRKIFTIGLAIGLYGGVFPPVQRRASNGDKPRNILYSRPGVEDRF